MYRINKDKKKRLKYYNNEFSRFFLRQKKLLNLNTLVNQRCNKTFYKSQIVNRCILTGKSKSVYRDFKLSRMKLRHFCSFGFFYGVHKAS